MKKLAIVGILIFIFFRGLLTAEETATPKEIIQKVEDAVNLVVKEKEAGFQLIRDTKGTFVWKDTYVFVLNLEGTIVAHPNHSLENKNLVGIRDVKGNMFAAEFVSIAKSEKGEGWSEYWWPKLEGKKVSRKISFIKKVPGMDYLIGAGIYSDMPMDEVIKASR